VSRARLAALKTQAGYSRALLLEIANAALPAYRPGETLDDIQLERLASAVEVLQEAGYDDATARQLIARHRDHDPDGAWRTGFWGEALHAASQRDTRTEHPAAAPADSGRATRLAGS
jgi:hypothetical protein